MSDTAPAPYLLPPVLISRADLARLAREVESLENELEAQRVRESADTASSHMPAMSRNLNDFLETNKLDIADDQTRMALKERLRVMKDQAPIIHMTFAADADPDSLRQLVTWLRTEVHPQALISVGLQPSIVGGVYMRTPNHVHDFTLRSLLAGKHEAILHELEGLA